MLVASLVVIAIPIFVLGFLLQLFIGVQLGWAKPTVVLNGNWGRPDPAGVRPGLGSFAYVLRLTGHRVIENMNADYVRTATAKGLSRPRVVCVHILRNSMIPVVTFLGADLGGLMGGAIVTEGIFNVPGVGNRLYQAILRREGPTVVSIVTVLVLIYCVSNLLVDLLYAWLDPRIRYDQITFKAEHFVAPIDETPLLATDSRQDRPGSAEPLGRRLAQAAAPSAVPDVVAADPPPGGHRLFPGLFTQIAPNDDCELANSDGAPQPGHPLGYTFQGCDVYSRVIHGTQASVTVGVLSAPSA